MLTTNYCTIIQRDKKIYFTAHNTISNYDYEDPHPQSAELITDFCLEYWNHIDGIFSSISQNSQLNEEQFTDFLITQGAYLCEQILSDTAREEMIQLASSAECLSLTTNMPYVPWEALYFGHAEEGKFLGDMTSVVRILKHQRTPKKRYSLQAPTSIFSVIIDPILVDNDENLTRFSSLGFQVKKSSTMANLREVSKSAKTMIWVCENSKEKGGLRIDKNVFYAINDAQTHLFPKDIIVFLTACRAGSDGNKEGLNEFCIAGEIQFASGCTVIAPTSVVAVDIGFEIAQMVASWLNTAKEGTTVKDFWIEVRSGYFKSNDTYLVSILSKFFCIYGDIKSTLR